MLGRGLDLEVALNAGDVALIVSDAHGEHAARKVSQGRRDGHAPNMVGGLEEVRRQFGSRRLAV